MGKQLCCPRCGSADLDPEGTPSLLDGKRGRRCRSCRLALAPRRNRVLMGGVFLLAAAVTVVCLVLLVHGDMVWIAGLVAGPLTMALSAAALFARMPVVTSSRDGSG